MEIGSNMAGSEVISLTIMSVFFYTCGGLCIFRTGMVVGWARKSYAKNKLVRSHPFSDMITKSWYPVYIRAAGVFVCLWALAIDYLVLFRGFR
jgi:hypothetical protein